MDNQKPTQPTDYKCPHCKKRSKFDEFLSADALGIHICPECGICFMVKSRIKIVKEQLKQLKKQRTEQSRILKPNVVMPGNINLKNGKPNKPFIVK